MAAPRRLHWRSRSLPPGLVTGPLFGFSDTWQLVINTGTTIVTFLMVFLIQNNAEPRHRGHPDQARRADPRHQGAHNALLDLEELEEGVLDAFRRKDQGLAATARAGIDQGGKDTGTPEA